MMFHVEQSKLGKSFIVDVPRGTTLHPQALNELSITCQRSSAIRNNPYRTLWIEAQTA
jgi:hypothetical protein